MAGGLTLALSNALTGLNVNQQALSVLSQNIANVNTPGYSRQILSLQSVYLDGQGGAGVSIGDITRRVDAYLAKSVQGQTSVSGLAGVLNDYNTRIQLFIGQPGSQNSVDSSVNSFFNALHSLAQSPEDSTLQRTMVNSGTQLATQIQHLAFSLRDLQFQSDQDIATAVNTLNDDLGNIADLNTTISNAQAVGRSTAELEDRRDVLLKDVAQYININTFTRGNGSINITTTNGISLLDENRYRFSYSPASSADTFTNGSGLAALTLQQLDGNGNFTGPVINVVSAGLPADVTSIFSSGKLQGLLQLRDNDLPHMLAQLDTLAGAIRDQVNAIHNLGSGFPGANSLTGTRLVSGQDFSDWGGSVRIALLDSNGQPIDSPYVDEVDGVPPLTLDLSQLNSGSGAGSPTVQGIIDAINQYYGIPQNKVELGALNNIQLVSDNVNLPGVPPQFNFDFDLNNLSDSATNFYITGVQVLDNTAADITSLTASVPTVALDAASTYTTSAGSSTVTITAAAAHGLSNGDVVYLSNPGGPVDGIPGANLSGFFTISGVTATTFNITAGSNAAAGMVTGVAAQTATPPYAQAAAGGSTRTSGNGIITADLSGNSSSPFYTILVDMAVDDGLGNISTSQVRYVINNNQTSIMNAHFAAQSATNDGTIVAPQGGFNQPLLTAKLVDANGVELPRVAGRYTSLEGGYLQIAAGNSSHSIAIDSLDSIERGHPNDSPPNLGTSRGFSHYFDLNDFFVSNATTISGDTIANSALNLAVSTRLTSDPALVSLGVLTRSGSSTSGALVPFTYERNSGDNTIVQRMGDLGTAIVSFAAAGGLGATSKSFSSYAGQIIGAAAANAATAKNNHTNAETLLDGFNQQASALSGVNLDTELANTVIYQNAYAASARIITVANTLFDTLLQSFG